MIDDQRFEIQSAFDLLPHVVGCSWATNLVSSKQN